MAVRPSSLRPGRRRRVIAIGVVVALAGIAAGLWVTDPFRRHQSRCAGRVRADLAGDGHPAVAVVADPGERHLGLRRQLHRRRPARRREPASQTAPTRRGSGGQQRQVSGDGTFTALPVGRPGGTARGRASTRSTSSPAVLLYGSAPASRTLSEGMSGADVQQLNADLVALGDATKLRARPELELLQRGHGDRGGQPPGQPRRRPDRQPRRSARRSSCPPPQG